MRPRGGRIPAAATSASPCSTSELGPVLRLNRDARRARSPRAPYHWAASSS